MLNPEGCCGDDTNDTEMYMAPNGIINKASIALVQFGVWRVIGQRSRWKIEMGLPQTLLSAVDVD